MTRSPHTMLAVDILVTIALTFGPMLLAIGEVVRHAA